MSGINFINRITGATNNLVYLETTDTSSIATATGYITYEAANINALNEGPWTWETNDLIFLSAVDGDSICVINSTFTTLTPIASNILPVPASVTNGIVAHPGGGQTNATQLGSDVNRVVTVASPGDSVKLPNSVPGYEIEVINSGANPMQVFGIGTDVINGQTSTVGVSQLPNSVVLYICAASGFWHSQDVTGGYADGNLPKWAYSNGLTAHSGGGQASALALVSYVNNISTVAAVGDSVRLPVSAAGMVIAVGNSATNAMQVYGAGTDTINAVATGTGVTQQPNTVCFYECSAAGAWFVNQNSLSNSINAGSNGSAGGFVSYPGTVNSGYFQLSAAVNVAGNFFTVLAPTTSVGQNQAINIPDSGSSSATLLINKTVQPMASGASIVLDKGTGTVSAGAVTVNHQAGVITAAVTTAGAATTAITFNNSLITSNSVLGVFNMGGTNTTIPGVQLSCAYVSPGVATINVTNNNVAGTALNNSVLIGFSVL